MAKRGKFGNLVGLIETRPDGQLPARQTLTLTKGTADGTEVGADRSTAVEASSAREAQSSNTVHLFEDHIARQSDSNSGADASTKRMSLYLDADLYWRISDYAHRNRSKMHPIILRELRKIMNELEADERASSSR
ncbi:hypothetical protein BSZ21_17570 [Bradyrhizobium canariense]|uniref:hypothetical protein n=1 Tax=Bradyrhizobium canariense TaxID=255045 RepID=UPI000A197AAA|nr:hypothetical protein [Bradyrhizobium canariense]OSI67401.1 hypothetical protein BSZ21_17570 [Bradyrhizobium canariense]